MDKGKKSMEIDLLLTLKSWCSVDHDLDVIAELSYDAGLNELAHARVAEAKAVGNSEEEIKRSDYITYSPHCSDIPAVRAHLGSGIFAKMIKGMEV
jgi:hypothetical protein